MRPAADNQAAAFPGYFFFDGERSVPKVVAELLGRLFLPVADPAGVNNDVVLMRDAIDPDGTKGKVFEPHLDLHWLQQAGWRSNVSAPSHGLFR